MVKYKGNSVKTTAVLFVSTVTVMAVAGLAWAWTPAAHIETIPGAGAAGTLVTVNGANFNPQAPVEIRWNDNTGTLLGTASGPDFSIQVAIPQDATADVHYIVALQSELDADQKAMRYSGKAESVFQVSSANSSTTSTAADLWKGFDSGSTIGQSSPVEAQSQAPSQASGLGMALLVTGAAATLLCLAVLAGRKRTARSHQNG